MKLVNIEQTIFIPVVDETHGGVTVEMKMTVGEFFEKCCAGFAPDAVEAIPVEWLKQWRDKLKGMGVYQRECAEDISFVLGLWQREQETQDDRG